MFARVVPSHLGAALLSAFACLSASLSPALATAAEVAPPLPPITQVRDLGLVKQNKYVNCRDGTYSALIKGKALWTFNDTCMSKGGVLGEYSLSEAQGNEIIMAARAHWFEDEPAAQEDADAESGQ